MLDLSNSEHKTFVEEFVEKLNDSKTDKRFYRKGDQKEKKSNKNKQKVNPNEGKNSRQSTPDSDILANLRNLSVTNDKPKTDTSTKKKTKPVNILADLTNDTVLVKGRHTCECLASKHELINNCLSCGRIVCGQEGEGPCLFCGDWVYNKNRPASERPKRPNEKNSKSKESADKAVEHKNMLLEFDRTSEKRTKVFDDQNDYFDSGSRWVSKDQRESLQALEQEIKEKKYSRSNQMTIDILGRQIVSDDKNDHNIYNPDDPLLKEILAQNNSEDIFSTAERNNMAPPIQLHKPKYVHTNGKQEDYIQKGVSQSTNVDLDRVQDRELQVKYSSHFICVMKFILYPCNVCPKLCISDD